MKALDFSRFQRIESLTHGHLADLPTLPLFRCQFDSRLGANRSIHVLPFQT